MSATAKHTPVRIWAKADSATIYMDGSSPVVGSTRQKPTLVEYVRADLCGPEPVDLLVAEMPDEDDIEEAISGSIDIDWTPRDAAKAVMRLLAKGVNKPGEEGELLEKGCPNDPESDPKNENIRLAELVDSVRALLELHEAHHNHPVHAAARKVLALATNQGGRNG